MAIFEKYRFHKIARKNKTIALVLKNKPGEVRYEESYCFMVYLVHYYVRCLRSKTATSEKFFITSRIMLLRWYSI